MDINKHDYPISTATEDRFGRSEYAKRIAELCEFKTGDSTVIGIYGKWGEGKSSMKNLIRHAVSAEILVLEFNPWYYKSEEELINFFFTKLADGFGRKLSSRKADFVNAIKKYGSALGVLEIIPKWGLFFKAIKPLTGLFAKESTPVNELKERVNEIIIDANVNIVVLMDDIDRLDAREVQNVFKLVKLVADFPRTSYILFFDPEVVARMLAPNFGGKVPESGYEYLEKIVQYPFSMPIPHEEHLAAYLQSTIKEAIFSSIEYDVNVAKNLEAHFPTIILPLLDTPRKIVRFGNLIRFSTRLLKGESNIVDLVLITVIKTALPEYYDFIRNHRGIYLENYLDKEVRRFKSGYEDEKKLVDQFVKRYSLPIQAVIRNATNHLFPYFFWCDPSEVRNYKPSELERHKRICTAYYFTRYFAYSLHESTLPDNHFERVYLNAGKNSFEQLTLQIRQDFSDYGQWTIAYKLSKFWPDIDWENGRALLKSFGNVSNEIEDDSHLFLGGAFSMFTNSLAALIRKSNEKDLRPEELVDFIEYSTNIDFVGNILAQLIMPVSERTREVALNSSIAQHLKSVFVKRLVTSSNSDDFLYNIREGAMKRYLYWWRDVDPGGMKARLLYHLNNDSRGALKILRIFTPTQYTVKGNDESLFPIKTNFDSSIYDEIDNSLGAWTLYEALLEQFGDSKIKVSEDDMWLNRELDDLTLIGRFQLEHLSRLEAANEVQGAKS